jgi:hypothetical protein
MKNRKTAMQKLFDNLESIDIKVPIGVKQIFLNKEEEQIIDAHNQGYADGYRDNGNESIDYYNETYAGDNEETS